MDLELENLFISTGTAIINRCKEFIEAAEVACITNEQWFLNFEDELNRLSTKDHYIAEWSSGSSLGSYPKGQRFESSLRN